MSTPFTLAIVGRPNVGKSTLFNRLAGKRLALVHDEPGLTRDWREVFVEWGDLSFSLIDTPGFEEARIAGSLESRMRQKTEEAIATADACLFVFDARVGLTALDRAFAALLRRFGKPCLLVANKCERSAGTSGIHEAFELGFGEALAVSAEHGEGLPALYGALARLMETHISETGEFAPETPAEEGPLSLAIMGRPNVGKSTLINQLLGKERMLAGPEAGMTRDAVPTDWTWQGTPIRLIDTAGMRRKSRVEDSVEKISVSHAVNAMRFAHVVVLLLEAGQAFEKQDLQIADLVAREGRGLVIGINKWDLVSDRPAVLKELRLTLEELLPQIRGVPLITLSAATGKGINKLMPAVIETYEKWNKHISTARLNRWLEDAIERHPPPAIAGRRLKLRYMTQAKTRPPGFVVFSNQAPDKLPEAYKRYLIHGLRETFELEGIPIRLYVRQSDNPYVSD